jgi:hypothetical protein
MLSKANSPRLVQGLQQFLGLTIVSNFSGELKAESNKNQTLLFVFYVEIYCCVDDFVSRERLIT